MEADPYTGWIALVVPTALRAAAAARVAQMTGREGDNHPGYFPVPLCAADDPHGEITHYMASPRARESIIQNLDEEAAGWPGCHVIMLRHDKLPREWRVNVTHWLRNDLGLMVWTEAEDAI